MSRLLLAILLAVSTLATARSVEPMAQRDHMRGARYGEVLVVTGGPFSFVARVYNTIGLNDCPEEEWKALDPEKLKKEYKARSIILNGPRYFLMDRTSIARPGPVETFGSLKLRHLADVTIALPLVLRGGSKPYVENTVKRNTEYVFEKGRSVYELISPDGSVYVMQSYSQKIDPNLREPDLRSLGSRLKLPAGWTYSTHMPSEDLTVRATGEAHVIQDELQNTYQRVDFDPRTSPKP